MECDVSKHGDFVILHIKEDITFDNSPFLDSLLESKIRSGQNSIVVDLSAINLIDSSGKAIFAKNFRLLKGTERRIVLAGCNPFLLKLFTSIGFHKFFKITATLEEALVE